MNNNINKTANERNNSHKINKINSNNKLQISLYSNNNI